MTINERGFFEEGFTVRLVASEREERSIEESQRDVYDSHRHRVFSVAYHMTGNELVAEQILTSTFVRAFSGIPVPDSSAVDKALIGELREHFPLIPTLGVLPTTGAMQGNIRRTDLEEAIQELSPAERLLFLLRDVEGYAAENISSLVDMPQAEVNKTLFAARIHLRAALAKIQARREAA